ncbi:alpha/beta fold hydrolase [Modestobacter excelsi]|uniref:alpha/beta fold hydrolase n=1 Tax=Modestobacter excelsi TaxID=2213161 RepID=UPI00110CDD0F|nr:alpha/beta hydrolase [Modestobacter excelsi]
MKTVQSSDGTTIAYDCSGDGLPLVIVAGAFGDRTSKRELTAVLGREYTVYEYDRRGRGDSGGTSASTAAQEVEDLSAVLAVAVDAIVFGDSSGGALAIEAAAAGVPMRGLAVYEVPYTDGPTLELADQLDDLVAADQSGEAVTAFLALMGTPPEAVEQMKAGPFWGHLERLAGTLSADVRVCNGGVVPAERLQLIEAPLLALAGGASPWAVGVAEAIAAAAPHGTLQILEAQGHAVDGTLLAAALAEFLR